MEILQISKYLAQLQRLYFTSSLLATEEECTIIDVPIATLTDLLQTGNIEDLETLISSSRS